MVTASAWFDRLTTLILWKDSPERVEWLHLFSCRTTMYPTRGPLRRTISVLSEVADKYPCVSRTHFVEALYSRKHAVRRAAIHPWDLRRVTPTSFQKVTASRFSQRVGNRRIGLRWDVAISVKLSDIGLADEGAIGGEGDRVRGQTVD